MVLLFAPNSRVPHEVRFSYALCYSQTLEQWFGTWMNCLTNRWSWKSGPVQAVNVETFLSGSDRGGEAGGAGAEN